MAEMRQADVQEMLRKMVEPTGSARAWAAKKGVNASYVSQVMRGSRPPSEALCKAMGIKSDGERWVPANGKIKGKAKR